MGRATDRQGERRAPSGWWGVAFVVLLVLAQGAVTLPRTTHTDAFIAAYYADHRAVIAVDQIVQLALVLVFWQFLRAFVATGSSHGRVTGEAARRVRLAGLTVVAASVLTCLPVLVLALAGGLSPGATRAFAVATDLTDVLLFAAVAVFALTCAAAPYPSWLRGSAAVLGALAAGYAVLELFGVTVLGVVAPVAFLLFVLALSVWTIRVSRGRHAPRAARVAM